MATCCRAKLNAQLTRTKHWRPAAAPAAPIAWRLPRGSPAAASLCALGGVPRAPAQRAARRPGSRAADRMRRVCAAADGEPAAAPAEPPRFAGIATRIASARACPPRSCRFSPCRQMPGMLSARRALRC